MTFHNVREGHRKAACKIPGVTAHGLTLRCAVDAAPAVAKTIGRSYNPSRDASFFYPIDEFEGAERYRQIFRNPDSERKQRDYQAAASLWLATRNGAINGDPMRSGKSSEVLGAAQLRNANRVLIICPAGARLGWAEEVHAWYGPKTKVVHLYGLAADKIRRTGERRYVYRSKDEDRFFATLGNARFVIVNYELLRGQRRTNDRGGDEGMDDRLQGWGPVLSMLKFDVAFLDEGSVLATSAVGAAHDSQVRRAVSALLGEASIPIVYELDGTPCRGGRLRSYWGQLDIVSGGMWGRAYSGQRKPFPFDARYCDGHHELIEYGRDEHGHPKMRQVWYADGITEDRIEEFLDRLDYTMIQRPRSFILPQLPPKTRQTKWIETDLPVKLGEISEGAMLRSAQSKWLATTLPIKLKAAFPEIVSELEEGCKLFLFTYRKRSAREAFRALSKIAGGAKTGRNLRAANLKAWLCIGNDPDGDDDEVEGGAGLTPDQRHALARQFREHAGAAIVVATITSLRGYYNFKSETPDHPVTSVHRVERHFNPDWMVQAEDRSYTPGITHGLSIIDWVVVGTPDEFELRKLAPKIKTIERAQTDGTTDGMRAAFKRESPEVHWRSVMDSMFAAYQKQKARLERASEDDDDATLKI